MALPTQNDVETAFVGSGAGTGFNTVANNYNLRELLRGIVSSLSGASGGGTGEETLQAGNPGDIAVFGESNILSGLSGFSFKNNIFTVNGAIIAYGVKLNPVTLASLGPAAVAGKGSKAIISDAVTPTFNNLAIGGGFVTTPVFSDGTTWKCG